MVMKTCSIRLGQVLLLPALSCVGLTAAAGGALPPVNLGPSAVAAARLKCLDNVAARFRKDVDHKPFLDPRLFKALVAKLARKYGIHAAGPPPLGHFWFKCRFSYLHGEVLYENAMTASTVAKLAPPQGPGVGDIKTIRTFTPARSESLRYQLHGTFPIGSIKSKAPLPWSTIDVALGLRGWGSEDWIRPSEIKKMRLVRLGGGRFSLVQKNPGSYDYRWTFRRRPHLELIECIASKGGAVFLRIRCSAFRGVQGLWLPERIKETDMPLGGKGRVSSTEVLTHIAYTVGSRWNTPKTYFIVWPKGSAVLDERVGQTFRILSRPRRLTDKAIFLLLRKWDTGWRSKRSSHR